MSYLIDRQAVIDLLKQMRKDGDMVPWEGKDVFARIRKLPTIQPEKAQLSSEDATSDTISRQAAIDAIEQLDIPEDMCVFEILSHIELAIGTLPPAQPEPQWIPVGEKLPETEDFVLASLSGKYRNTTFEHACEIADYADGEWCIYAYPNMSAEKCAELIEAWMPLPEAYKPNK